MTKKKEENLEKAEEELNLMKNIFENVVEINSHIIKTYARVNDLITLQRRQSDELSKILEEVRDLAREIQFTKPKRKWWKIWK